MNHLPTGTVTFLFTDIEGSTKLLQQHRDRYPGLLEEHDRISRDAVEAEGGTVVSTEGDSFFVVFPSHAAAVRAAVEIQRRLHGQPWSEGAEIRVRMGLHTGDGVLGGDNYVGLDVHRAARIAAAGHGGQVLLSSATRVLVEGVLPDGVGIRDLGQHRLKDLERPEHVAQLVIDGLPAEFPAVRSLEARPTNLPAQRTTFVGREHEAARVKELLEETRLLTLTGPGGTGKTRLALKVATDLLEAFPDGVFFVDLSPIGDPAIVPSAIAGALVIREEPGRPILDTLADALRDRNLLLVLDNFEQVMEATPTVKSIVEAAPSVKVLVTTRVPLHLYGEQEFPVPPLGLPDPRRLPALEALTQFEAVALFIDRATAVRPDFRVTNENAPAVAELTARLDGLPLAIELAASRVKLLTPQAMLTRLGQRLPLLAGGARDLPERQRTLRGAIAWSHDLLDEPERQLFARLSVFAGGWTLDAAEAVCGPGLETDPLGALESLVDKSLVRRQETLAGDARFSMLETIREYATDELRGSGEEPEIRRRHADHFRILAEEAEPHLTGVDQVAWLDRFDDEHDNVRATLAWAIDGDVETGLRTGAALWRFWHQRGYLSEGRVWCQRLIDVSGAARTAPRARTLMAMGSLAYWQNDYPAARAAYEEATDISRELGDPGLLAAALYNLSYMPLIEKDHDAAEALLLEGLEAARADGATRLIAEMQASLSFIRLFRGEPAAAKRPLEEAIEIMRGLADQFLVADNLIGLASIHLILGETEQARPKLAESLRIVADAGSPTGIQQGLTGFSVAAETEGDFERTARLLGAAARIRDEVGGGAPPELVYSSVGDPEGRAREALGDEAFERAKAEGRAMTTDEAVAFALEKGG